MLDLYRFVDGGELFDGRYKLIQPLSMDGATADVWLAVDSSTMDVGLGGEPEEKKEDSGMHVAIKVYRPKNALDIEGEQLFREEFKIVYECRHENLLQPTAFSVFKDKAENKDYPYLVLPYCPFGSSEMLIGQLEKEDDIWKFIGDVSAGLARLHANNPQIIHQDIKPANILVDNMNNYAITDFGISARLEAIEGTDGVESKGTLAYMAPERFRNDAVPMPESDIWAFGATLFEILTGKVPFGEGGGQEQEMSKVEIPSIPGVPPDVVRLVHACLEPEPGNRPTAWELKEAARLRRFRTRSKEPGARKEKKTRNPERTSEGGGNGLKYIAVTIAGLAIIVVAAVFLYRLFASDVHDDVVQTDEPVVVIVQPETPAVSLDVLLKERSLELARKALEEPNNPAVLYALAYKVEDGYWTGQTPEVARQYWDEVLVPGGDVDRNLSTNRAFNQMRFAFVCAARAYSLLDNSPSSNDLKERLKTLFDKLKIDTDGKLVFEGF